MQKVQSIVMKMAWRFVKRNGYTMSEALKCAWRNVKIKAQMHMGIVKFYFLKVDGTIREAYGTLKEGIAPKIESNDRRVKNESVQTYYDTEKGEWRCFKIANLL